MQNDITYVIVTKFNKIIYNFMWNNFNFAIKSKIKQIYQCLKVKLLMLFLCNIQWNTKCIKWKQMYKQIYKLYRK